MVLNVLNVKVSQNIKSDGNSVVLKINGNENSNGIIYFILKLNKTFNSSTYLGVVISNLKISHTTIEYSDKYDRIKTEEQEVISEDITPVNEPKPQPVIGPIDQGSSTVESLANIQQAILKLL